MPVYQDSSILYSLEHFRTEYFPIKQDTNQFLLQVILSLANAVIFETNRSVIIYGANGRPASQEVSYNRAKIPAISSIICMSS